MEEFSVCFTDPLIVDMTLFWEWLIGASEIESAKKLAVSTTNPVGDIPYTIVVQEVREQYVLFRFLQQYLQSPPLLDSPILSSLSPKVKEKLLESYYEFDKEVMREILGKKMSAKLRKDMDDVSERTGIPLRSCQRQFDNIKNIIKTYEDMEGGVMVTLTKQFLFSNSLVQKYYPLVFVFISRFETAKKRLQYLSYDDIINCTECILTKWTFTPELHNSGEKIVEHDEVDRHFIQELRDLRNLTIDKDFQDVHKSLIMNRMDKNAATPHFIKSMEANFKMFSRNIFVLGAGLTHTKDFRDFFNDCVEKLVEPVKQLEWSSKEFDVFLTAMINSWGDFKEHYEMAVRNLDAVYIRYMEVMKRCLLFLYK
ncbi:acidic fibroblast growth factor intracellular-binding protein-like isoform X1 [Hydractinia symbiolongicarpus]|uniref:acidic fibroblast growth factor intracellular-binding protein-like isoform X1 n=2 Tax=Hydractinia symbiolongicarpus TaxID=13093 RepID=UPI00254E58C6|nr:acidic fibroblast growth factor intracellular-binding protein-like isoform X1 [Hydractinia symbiolongicarpus]